jgi:hypothetical protein
VQVLGGVGAGIGHVPLDAGAELLDVVGKEAFDQDNAVALEGVYVGLGDEGVHGLLLGFCK